MCSQWRPVLAVPDCRDRGLPCRVASQDGDLLSKVIIKILWNTMISTDYMPFQLPGCLTSILFIL